MTTIFIITILSYMLGSIPFGLVLTHLAGKGDIRKAGSGNIGATNVLRTSGKALGAATLILDALKGAVAVYLVQHFFPETEGGASLAALSSVLGHVFPVWLKFKGGKGVATTLAVVTALYWPLGVIACACWLAVFMFSKISSLSALCAMASLPVATFLLAPEFPYALPVTCGLAFLVILRHHSNIRRLLQGEESGFSRKK